MSTRRRLTGHGARTPLVLVLGCLVGLGCSGGQEPEEDFALGPPSRLGLVAITYEHDWGAWVEALAIAEPVALPATTGEGRLTATAQFVRYSALDRDEVSRLLSLPLDPDLDLPPLDSCQVFDLGVDLAASATFEAGDHGNVELLEAGDLRIETPSKQVILAPRHFPMLLPFVSGVVYGEAQSVDVGDLGPVQVSSEGGESVGAFVAQVASPSFPRLSLVGGRGPERAVLDRGNDLALRWEPSPATGTGTEPGLTYIELRYTRARRDLAVRCRPADDGSFTVPQAFLAEIEGKVSLEVARLHRTFFAAGGLDRAELHVTVRDIATLAAD